MQKLHIIAFLAGVTLALTAGVGAGTAHAQQCADPSLSKQECREKLRSQLQDVQKDINKQETKLQNKRQERRSLERDVEILEAEIHKARLKIKKHDIEIRNLSDDIASKQERIKQLNNKIDRLKESLAQLVRRRARVDDMSFVELALSNQSVSQFFRDIGAIKSLNSAMQSAFAQLRTTRAQAEEKKTSLADRKTQVANARAAIAAEKEKIENKEAEKEELLSVAKSKERTYKQVLQQKKQKAQEIRNRLFALRNSEAIPFGRALRFARDVSGRTGVRPAFLLAILRQESNLGKNVGTCNRPQDPESKSWRNIMKPSRDIQPYKKITSKLGLDPDTQPLSCPYGNGWGGAMGPSQFIPSTWLLYEDRIANALGVQTPNPWKPKHAFMASGIYLSDLGADSGGYSAEKRAALKYYAGSNWQSPNVQFYGEEVMQKARDIQQNMIDPIDEAEA